MTGDDVRSPSVQCRIDPRRVVFVSTHEQVLGGRSGQVFVGCEFASDHRYRAEPRDSYGSSARGADRSPVRGAHHPERSGDKTAGEGREQMTHEKPRRCFTVAGGVAALALLVPLAAPTSAQTNLADLMQQKLERAQQLFEAGQGRRRR